LGPIPTTSHHFNSASMIQEDGEVVFNEPVAQDIYLMRLRAPRIARDCRPAQFVQIRTAKGLFPYLRRPFSALRVDRKDGWIDILYDVIGPGTLRMSVASEGDALDLIGPLGCPFDPSDTDRLLLIAGGVGLVPLAFLTWEAPRKRSETIFLLGAATKIRMPDPARLLPPGIELHLATEDGSAGHRGLVTDLIPTFAQDDKTLIFTCGPDAMMSRVATLAAERGLPCFASLENHMACGFGACVGCVVKYREAVRDDMRFRRACLEGPVVDAHQIVW